MKPEANQTDHGAVLRCAVLCCAVLCCAVLAKVLCIKSDSTGLAKQVRDVLLSCTTQAGLSQATSRPAPLVKSWDQLQLACDTTAKQVCALYATSTCCTGASAFAAAAARVAAMAAAGAGTELALPPLPPTARSTLGSRDGQRSADRLLL